MAPRVNGLLGFSGGAAIRDCRRGLRNLSCCKLASCENYSNGPKRPSGHSHVVAVKVFYSDMSAKDPENFASIPKFSLEPQTWKFVDHIALTLVYGGIGLLDDTLSLVRKHNYGLPGRIKFVLQVVAGIGFFLWLKSANVSSSNITKTVVPLPAPVGHLALGKWYMALTAFCCAAMSNGVNLTDGLDGLAGGTEALRQLPLGRFGSSMAGACFGFLVHNRYKAEVFMGDTGSLALGGALAAIAASTRMFFPLFVASGVFVVETLSVIGQVSYFQLTKRLYGEGRRWLRMAPLHHHLEFLGFVETRISTLAYAVGIILFILAAYSGLLLS
ncbi:hypothetical protein R1sor_020447 [Riccia sorocarpa]|uniref:Phospho-N-acetylmuramoyl-pentapeptide-transferase n=1 Tax=Riccia sorocarpa TaxID=122646 RepID=A0ABD3IJ86_9MARC